MYSNIRPLADRIVIRRLESAEEKSTGGIIIPDAAKEKSQIGEVIAVGTGRIGHNGSVIPVAVKKGDKVLFGKYAGTEVDKDLLIVREEDILGVL
ncbi:MAG: co-chaperone GroES [Candidatus Babeliaceae bacterium]|nr:co-chaperone GroES [Candidatus Babeliaceae bacterium]